MLLTTLLWLLTILILGLVGFLLTEYRHSGIPAARKKLQRAVGELKGDQKRARKLETESKRSLSRASSLFLESQRKSRLEAFPVESLKEHGASGVRLSALRNAGLNNLRKVEGVSASRLTRLRGIGPSSAARIAAAAKKAKAFVLSMAPDLPRPTLEEPQSLEIARAALTSLTVREELSRQIADFETPFREVIAEVNLVLRRGSLRSWYLAPSRIELASEVASRAESLLVKLSEFASSEVHQRLQTGCLLVENSQSAVPEAVRARFRKRYADLAALIERSFQGGGEPEPLPRSESGSRPKKITRTLVGFSDDAKALRPALQDGDRESDVERPARIGSIGLPKKIAQTVERFSLDAKPLRAILRGYQEFGAKFILVQKRTILGDEMGLGKTIEALAAMCHLHGCGSRHFLVAAPAGTIWNWASEVSKHSALKAHMLHPSLESNIAAWAREGGVAITSYDVLARRQGTDALTRLSSQVDLLVVDEAHYAKNPSAKRSKAIAEIAGKVPLVCLMSGTPLENRLEEFFRLGKIVRPEVSYLRHQDFNPATFQERMAGLYLRRNQTDVLRELPELIEVEEWVDLLPSDANVYAEAVRAGNFMAMRQSATLGDGQSASSKMLHLDELMEDHRESGRKVLIFSFFLEVLSAVAERVGSSKRIDGSTSPAERQRLIDAFQEASGHHVLLCQIIAGGHGVNLQAASAVVIMEPQLKPSTEQQAVARAHRMGQTERVIVHRLLARDSVDERLVEILRRKREVFDDFARESRVKDASDQAVDISLGRVGSLGAEIIDVERRRLGIA